MQYLQYNMKLQRDHKKKHKLHDQVHFSFILYSLFDLCNLFFYFFSADPSEGIINYYTYFCFFFFQF